MSHSCVEQSHMSTIMPSGTLVTSYNNDLVIQSRIQPRISGGKQTDTVPKKLYIEVEHLAMNLHQCGLHSRSHSLTPPQALHRPESLQLQQAQNESFLNVYLEIKLTALYVGITVLGLVFGHSTCGTRFTRSVLLNHLQFHKHSSLHYQKGEDNKEMPPYFLEV